MRQVLIAVFLLVLGAGPVAAGVREPADITLAALLEHHRQAAGTWIAPKTLREEWSFSKAGLHGVQTTVAIGDDSSTSVVEGPIAWSYGRYHEQNWWHNKNGITLHVRRRPLTAEPVRTDSSAPVQEDFSRAVLLGMSDTAPRAYVVEMNPGSTRRELVYYDAASWLIVRRERSDAKETQVETLDDYRLVARAMRPFHIHDASGAGRAQTDWRLTRLELDGDVGPGEVAVPETKMDIAMPAQHPSVILPATFSSGRIIVRANVNGRGLDLRLDSGTSGIVLDSTVAAQLHLQTYGLRTSQEPTASDETDALIPELDVGDVRMRKVAVTLAPFHEQENPSTAVVGLLGFDFFAEGIVRIDYNAQTVTFINPATFAPPPGSRSLDALLDDAVPVVDATVGTAAGRFILDTGSDLPLIFSRFAAQHPADVSDQGIGKQMAGTLGVVGVDGAHDVAGIKLRAFCLGSTIFIGEPAVITPAGDSYESAGIDGVIGISVLEHFVIDLDYGNARVILESPSSA
jgi:hypothetical protein